jgi:hypothetical protein
MYNTFESITNTYTQKLMSIILIFMYRGQNIEMLLEKEI